MITIDISGQERLQEGLKRLQQKLTSLKDPMDTAGNYLYNITSKSFDNESSPLGTPWHPLAKSTQAYKAKHGGNKILQSKTPQMATSLIAQTDDHSVVVGVNAVSDKGYFYPQVHQFGSSRVPARPFFPIENGAVSRYVEDEIVEIFMDYLREFEG